MSASAAGRVSVDSAPRAAEAARMLQGRSIRILRLVLVLVALFFGLATLVAGTRVLPPQLRTAIIHRIELPQGRFERRVRLPAGRYRDVARAAADGCLVITLRKAEAANG